MKFTRPFVFTLSTLALLISACNQALPGATPGALTPQFSTMAGDAADQLAVGEDGVYLGGTWSGKPSLIKFGRAGNIPWTRSVGGQVVEVALDSGGNAYVVFYSTADNAQHFIRKYTPSGTFVWQRQFTIPGADGSGYYASDMDAQNNVYLSYATSDKTELRKYSSSGSVLWTKTYGAPAYDDARGIATISGSEAYVTGETQGSLAHTNIGGRDGYLRKLNSSGDPTWTR